MDLALNAKRFDHIADRAERRRAITAYLLEYPLAVVYAPPVNEGNYHTQVHEDAQVPIMIYGVGRSPGGRVSWTARHPWNNNISEVVGAETGYLATHFAVATAVVRIPTDAAIRTMLIEELSAAQGDFHNRQDALEAGLTEAQAKVADAVARVERALERMPTLRFQGAMDALQERLAAVEQRPVVVPAPVEQDPEIGRLRSELAGVIRRLAALEGRLQDLMDAVSGPDIAVEAPAQQVPEPEPLDAEVATLWTEEALAELPWPVLRKLGVSFGADTKAKKEDILALCLGKPRE